MERMNEILARAASRRVSTRRTPTPAPSTISASSSGSRATPRRIVSGQASGKPVGSSAPLRPIADTNQATQPAADVLDNDSDRILELPTRPSNSIIRPSGGRSDEMTSIRELAPTYAARLGPRHLGRPAAPAAPASPALSALTTQNDSSSATSVPRAAAPRGRAARTTGKLSAPGVCPLCHGAGYVRLDVPVGDPAFGQAIRCQCKEQQIEERDRSNLRRLSNLDPFRDKTFESFDSKRPGNGIQEAYKEARTFAKDPLGWLIFRGGYGCGKTHLAAAIANAAEKNGIPVIFAIVPELLDHLRATFAPNSDIPYDALFDKIREVNLLILDDFGAENGTAWATEKLFQLINYRYNFQMPTVITTNDRLLSRVDERISSRLFDQGLVRHVIIDTKDYRKYRKPPNR
jgi:DNA replication protein DnaC